MTDFTVRTNLQTLRRIAVYKQRLFGIFPKIGKKDDILSTMKEIAYIQWDPITIVAPSHLISLWSRVGKFKLLDLEKLMWKDRRVFIHWTPVAMLVLTDDYPIFNSLMKRYPESLGGSWGSHIVRAKKFLSTNSDLRKKIVRELRGGPLRLDQLSDYAPSKRGPDGWSSDSIVSNMLHHLHLLGEVMVVGNENNQKIWGLSEDFLPDGVDRTLLTREETDSAAAIRALKAIGPATKKEINYYFVRGRYYNLDQTISRLMDEGKVRPISVEGIQRKEERYIIDDDVGLLDNSLLDDPEPRVSLLSPFDNLVFSRDRTRLVFGFDYIHEQFLPKEKRKYGTYVLPILWGEKIIGRIDPKMDRLRNVLKINSVHAEPNEKVSRDVVEQIGERISDLADFLGAEEIEYPGKLPPQWKGRLS